MSSTAAALRYWEQRQEVASNNLANVSTDGFKGQRVFATMIQGALPAADTTTDFTPGAVTPTGNPLDLSIEGRGFLVVQGQNGERLSRGGTLHVSEDGMLTDSAGNALLGSHGPIRVADRGNRSLGAIQVSPTGQVSVDNTVVGQLRLETIPATTMLAREGNGLYIPPQQRTPMSGDSAVLRQGALEASNVNSVGEMVDMISIQRAYSAVEKAMSTLDSTRGIATTELGRPIN